MKCKMCGKEKTQFYIGVCYDCWNEWNRKEMERGSLPIEAFKERT